MSKTFPHVKQIYNYIESFPFSYDQILEEQKQTIVDQINNKGYYFIDQKVVFKSTVKTALGYKSKIQQDISYFVCNPATLYFSYNLLENNYMRYLLQIFYRKVSQNERLFLSNKIFQENFQYKEKEKFPSLNCHLNEVNNHILILDEIEQKASNNIFQVRILGNKYFIIENLIKQRIINGEEFEFDGELKSAFKKVIINVHGGGFVCMNTHLHQNYLREYVLQENCLLFTVDYPKTPMKSYYGILDVIIRYYLFIIYLIKNVVKCESEIILCGDSAGGNLIVALQQWIIRNNLENPKGIMLNYPALDMCFNRFYQSYFNLYQGQLINIFLFKMIMSYLLDKDDDCENDPFLNAVKIDQEFLKQFPTTYILTCHDDPLRDQGVYFACLLQESGVDVYLEDYMETLHGMLNLSMLPLNQAAQQYLKRNIEIIHNLFN